MSIVSPDINNQIAKNYLNAFENDKPQLALWMNGGAGAEIPNNALTLFDRKGFREEPTNNIPTTVERNVALYRQSPKKTDPKYNFYVQSDIMELAMNYSSSEAKYPATLADLMVTRQGGSLKGSVELNGGQGYGLNHWAAKVEINKPVSRPWIEWMKDELVDMEETEAKAVTEATALPLPPDYEGPTTLALDQPREVTFSYVELNAKTSDYPAQLDVIFAGSDVTIESAHPINVTGSGKSVKVKLRGTQLTSNPASPTKMKVTIRHSGESVSSYLYEIPIWVFNAGMAVDYNRDGEIHFAYENVDPSKSDEIPSGKAYEFWVNDDHDMPNDDGVQDDVNDGLKDSQFTGIPYLRGLEDFTRLWVKRIEADFAQKEFVYGLRFEEPQSPTLPQIKLFYATDPDGGLGYLQDETLGHNQLSSQEDSHFAGDVGTGATKSISFVDASKSDGHYIFESLAQGKAKLVLTVQYGGVNVARYKVPVQIRPITDFYEEYTVGTREDDDPDTAPNIVPISIRDSIPPEIVDAENKDYILYVHGWNMEGVKYKESWAETAYKRLWWLGYKGRFGLFRWPCRNLAILDTRGFNESEYNAWMSGSGLRSLLE